MPEQHPMTAHHPERSTEAFFGRRKGKRLRPGQIAALETLLPVLKIDLDRPAPEDIRMLFARPVNDVRLEIGFGGGEHMVAMAAANPSVGLIGAEPFINGVAMLLGRIRAAGVSNIAIHPGDVRDLMDVLPAASIARAFLNYPDPWPKARHHRRRFVTPEHLAPLHRALRPGAEFRIATDIPDYVRQALEEVPAAGFVLQDQGGVPWADWPSTRYEQKALREGRVSHYLTFRR